MEAHHPQRISSLTLMTTTSDARSNLAAIQGKQSKSPLSAPKPTILAWVKSYIADPPKTLKEKVDKFLDGVRIQNGSKLPFDEELNHQLALQSFVRERSSENMFNHLKAAEVSYDLCKQAIKKIKAPTLIIQGGQDPIFPMDHGEALKKAIPHANLAVIDDMGHWLNTQLYGVLIDKIVSVARSKEQ